MKKNPGALTNEHFTHLLAMTSARARTRTRTHTRTHTHTHTHTHTAHNKTHTTHPHTHTPHTHLILLQRLIKELDITRLKKNVSLHALVGRFTRRSLYMH